MHKCSRKSIQREVLVCTFGKWGVNGYSYSATSCFFILQVCLFWFLVIVFNLFYGPLLLILSILL